MKVMAYNTLRAYRPADFSPPKRSWPRHCDNDILVADGTAPLSQLRDQALNDTEGHRILACQLDEIFKHTKGSSLPVSVM
jgi:hypothetical protein